MKIEDTEESISDSQMKIDELEKEIRECPMNQFIDRIFEKFKAPKNANRKEPFFNNVTTARAFEYFAAAFFVRKFPESKVDLKGGANDRGVDCELKKDDGTGAVIQVKCGKQFENGGGNSIVLQLAGSCLLKRVHEGFIFSSEPMKSLSQHTRDIVSELHKCQEYSISVSFYFIDGVQKELQESLEDRDSDFAMNVLEDFKKRLLVKKGN